MFYMSVEEGILAGEGEEEEISKQEEWMNSILGNAECGREFNYRRRGL